MIAYTNYSTDARVRREAETLTALDQFEVVLFALKEDKKPRTYEIAGVKVREFNISKYRGKRKIWYLISYIRFFIRAFFACSMLLTLKKLDVVHVHNMPNFLVGAAILPRLCGKKVILDIHDSMPETYLTKFDKGLNRLIFRLLCWEEALCCSIAHKIICVNHVQSAALIKRKINPKKMVISMNVPDPRVFVIDTTQNKGSDRNGFKLVYHGTLSNRLGIDIAIRAVSKLVDEIPGLEFFIMGNGDDLDEYVGLSKSLGLNGRIHFNREMVPIEKLGEMIQQMDLGVVSNRKNFATELMLPVKMLEYIALNIPVVAPRLKTIEHYFTDDMIGFFEPENCDSLASAILTLKKNKRRRENQVVAARRFLGRYGWEKHKMELINLYQEI